MPVCRVSAIALVCLCLSLAAEAQVPEFVNVSDTLSSSTDSFVVQVRGFASLRLQTLDTYSGTWELQCSVDGGTTYDTDDELNLILEGAVAAAVQSVTDTVGIWTTGVAGCTHVRVIATAGFAATDTTIAVSAVEGGVNGQVTLNSGGIVTAAGAYANDADAAGTNRLPTLPVITETSAPSRTNGRNAALSGTAGGSIRVMIADAAGAAITVATDATHDSAANSTGPQNVGVAAADGTLPTAVSTAGDAVRLAANLQGVLYTRSIDPCSLAKTHIPIDIVTATDTELTASLAGASNHYYVCSINLVTAGANNVALVDDDSDGCGSITSGVGGGSTAAEGWNFAANGGLAMGDGTGTIFKTNGTNRVLCLRTSAAVQLSGSITVVAHP